MKTCLVILSCLLVIGCSKNEQKDAPQTESPDTTSVDTPSSNMPVEEPATENTEPVEPTAAEKTAMCAAKIERGTCKGKLLRFAYDAEKDVCEQFTFTGCGGTKNNFRTRELCEKTCYKPE